MVTFSIYFLRKLKKLFKVLDFYFIKNSRNTINVLILYFFKLLKYLPIYLLRLTFPNSSIQLIKRFYFIFSFIAVISHIFFFSFAIIFIPNTFVSFLVVFLYRFGNTFLLLFFCFPFWRTNFYYIMEQKKNFYSVEKKIYAKQREEGNLKQFVYIRPNIFLYGFYSVEKKSMQNTAVPRIAKIKTICLYSTKNIFYTVNE